MITLLVGHRGTGKSQLLKRIAEYASDQVLTYDLDQEISQSQGRSLLDLFSFNGEEYFRKIEIKTLIAVILKARALGKPAYIAAGAGLDLKKAAKLRGVRILWVKRLTDPLGRVFLDRPRLKPEVDPLTEYHALFNQREHIYKAYCHQEILIPEGWDFANESEKLYFLKSLQDLQGAFTLFPKHISLINEYRNWKVSFFELRTDILSQQQIALALEFLPRHRVLHSLRTPHKALEGVRNDWAIELGPPPPHLSFFSISLHERLPNETLTQAAERLMSLRPNTKTILKFTPEVQSFAELLEGHQWALKDPLHRTFLPRGGGRWIWYRILTKGLFPIQFFREGNSEQEDLPLLLDWCRAPLKPSQFTAVLGDPVIHSRTPATHWSQMAPAFSVTIRSDELNQALPVLEQLGLNRAAVTSPLKFEAATLIGQKHPVNTLHFDFQSKAWTGVNTDADGLMALLGSESKSSSTVVWGGGGTLEPLRKVASGVRFFSARTGQPRTIGTPMSSPQTLIWAAPRRNGLCQPPPEWKPSLVIDLSYFEDSPGREYALTVGAQYQSGITMFIAQAIKQREYWMKSER